MKKEEIIQAFNEVDDDLLESAQQARLSYTKKNRQTSMIRRTVISLTAMAAVITGVMMINRQKPEEAEPVAAVTPDSVPDTGEQGEKAVLTLSHKNTAGAGMSVVMYPDLKEETDYSPWNESMNLTEMPVYERFMNEAGLRLGLSEEEMRSILEKTADRFGYTLTNETVHRAGDYDQRHETYQTVPGVEDGTALSINNESDEARFTCFADGEVTIFFNSGYEPHVQQGLKMNVYDQSEEEAEKTAEYLAETYGTLLGEGEIVWDVGGDFGYNSQPSQELGEKEGLFRMRNYRFWEKGASNQETILNYAFHDLQVWGHDPEDATLIAGIRIENRLPAYEKTADYSLISVDQAYEQLLAGNCIANAGGILPDEKTETGKIEMVYWDNPSSQYVFPCYLFYMDITDALKEKNMINIEGVRQYGLYWVPAIDPACYVWQDEPDGTASAAAEDGKSQPEPVVISNSISMERVKQETDWYCAVACTQMILNHFGIDKDQNSLAAELNTYAPGVREDGIKGTYDTDVARVLNEYLFNGQPENETDGGYRVQPAADSFVWENLRHLQKESKRISMMAIRPSCRSKPAGFTAAISMTITMWLSAGMSRLSGQRTDLRAGSCF